MKPSELVVVSGDGRILDPSVPQLHADDLGLLHGDGVFETLLVREGRALLLGAHLARLATGAGALQLPPPDAVRLAHAVEAAVREWSARFPGLAEAMLRIVHTRGRESAPGAPTTFVMVKPVPERSHRVRRDGVTVVTLDRGTAPTRPWELAAVKTLSYASNMAALRYARSLGADDALLHAGGRVLESPLAGVVAVCGGELVSPPAADGLLPGTTVGAVLDLAAAEGIPARYRSLRVDELAAAESLWLLSAVTLAARIYRVDGVAVGDQAAPTTVDVQKLTFRAVGRT